MHTINKILKTMVPRGEKKNEQRKKKRLILYPFYLVKWSKKENWK